MSDEPEARMWDEDRDSRFDERSRGAFYESAFASSENLDRAPLLAEESYTEVPVSAEESDHCHWEPPPSPPSAVPQLVVALVLCGFFMICEVIGGYLAGSLSVMCDAAHMLSDCGGFALALLALHCARRPPDHRFSMGYKRAEVLGAMVSVLLIWVLTGIFVYVAAARLHSGEYHIEPDVMLVVSGCGVAFNVILALVLHGCGNSIAHAHTHGGAACAHSSDTHAHTESPRFGYFRRKQPKSNGALINGDYRMREVNSAEPEGGSQEKNINLRAALIHVIGDLIQSCGVLLASIVIKFYPSAKWIDPICTFVFSVLVLMTSARVVRDAILILMQAVPSNFKYAECARALRGEPGVRHVHSLHAWALSSHHVQVSVHVAIDAHSQPWPILASCQRRLRAFGAASAAVQIERYTPRAHECPVCVLQPP